MINSHEDQTTTGRKNRALFIWTPTYVDRNFQARFFINRVLDNLVDNGLGLNDFWLDVKERLVLSPMRCSSRMRAAETCQAAILFLLWPNNENSEQPALLSVTELAELSVMCVRSTPSTRPSSTAAKRSSLLKLYVVCQDFNGTTIESVPRMLPPSLDYALTMNTSDCFSIIRIPWTPSDVNISTSLLRETAGVVSGELITRGLSTLCGRPASMPTRAAWLLALQQKNTSATTSKVVSPSRSVDAEDDNNSDVVAPAAASVTEQPNWKSLSPLEWTPTDVQDFLASINIPEVIRMRIEELAIDGTELSVMDATDYQNHIFINSVELCRLVCKKIQQHISGGALRDLLRSARRLQSGVYIIFDPRDGKIVQHLKRQLEKLNFQVCHHGQLGRSRSEFALSQLPKMLTCSYFIVVLSETALASPFIWEEVCLLRSVIQPSSSAIISLSWNIGAGFMTGETVQTPTNFSAPATHRQAGFSSASATEELLPIPSVILMLADVQNIPLLVVGNVSLAMQKVGRIVESALRVPPPGIVFASPASNEYDDILAPNYASCDALMLLPVLSSTGSGSSSNVAANRKLPFRHGFLISSFLQPYIEMSSSIAYFDQRMVLLSSVYISPPIDVVLLCDWADANIAAVPLLTALRNAGLKCFADFENPLSTSNSSVKSPMPKSRLRLLLLTASSGHLRPSHPLLSPTVIESSVSPLLFVMCSRSPTISSDETPPSSGRTSAMNSGTTSIAAHASMYNSQQPSQLTTPQPFQIGGEATLSPEHAPYPSALLLDMSSLRGLGRFVTAICQYLGR